MAGKKAGRAQALHWCISNYRMLEQTVRYLDHVLAPVVWFWSQSPSCSAKPWDPRERTHPRSHQLGARPGRPSRGDDFPLCSTLSRKSWMRQGCQTQCFKHAVVTGIFSLPWDQARGPVPPTSIITETMDGISCMLLSGWQIHFGGLGGREWKVGVKKLNCYNCILLV